MRNSHDTSRELANSKTQSNPVIKAKTLYDYQAQRTDELSFKKDIILIILQQNPNNWWLAKLNNQEGLIPANYVQIIAARALPKIPASPPATIANTTQTTIAKPPTQVSQDNKPKRALPVVPAASSVQSMITTTTPQEITAKITELKKDQLNAADWESEKINFIPLRGSWFANSEADFDLEEEINKFLVQQINKKVMLLMGDSGAGKSLFTQGVINKLWQNFSAQSPIPIWISLPSLKDPVNRVIEETFEKYGFNKGQIEELRKTRAFLFILDAYDENRCEKDLYQTNNLDKWNAKIIITCRREYLYHKDNYKLFFAPFIEDKIQYSQYEEIYIRPFNANQIQTYVQQYIKTQTTNWKEPEKYQKAIEEITGLKELIKTPFMLKLTVEVLPQIVEKYITANLIERKKVTQSMRHGRPKAESKSPRSCALSLRSNRAASSRLKNMLRELAM